MAAHCFASFAHFGEELPAEAMSFDSCGFAALRRITALPAEPARRCVALAPGSRSPQAATLVSRLPASFSRRPQA